MPSSAYTYRDLNLLFAANPITGDVSCTVDIDDVKQAVVNLIQTNHYERLFHPEIGSNVSAILFDNADASITFRLTKAIKDVLANFEPRVTVTNVNVNLQPDQNGAGITITFYINNISTAVSVDFFLERAR